MPKPFQVRLLGFLGGRAFRRVAGTRDIHVDLCVIAATNRELPQLISEGLFRTDLFYRINVFRISIHPLRERPEDLEALLYHFVEVYNLKFGKRVNRITQDARKLLSAHCLPGNVRELRNAVERAMILAGNEVLISKELFFDDVSTDVAENHGGYILPSQGIDFEEVEKDLLRQALQRAKENQSLAAKLLNMTRDQFRYRAKRHQLL